MNLPWFKNRSVAAARTILAAGVITASLSAHAQGASPENSSSNPATVERADQDGAMAASLKEAAKLNLTAIRFAEIATERADNPELKRFGQSLAIRHKDAQSKLENIAQKYKVTLPTRLDAKSAQQVDKLQGLSGSAFDKEYARGAVEGYATALAQLRTQEKEKQSPDVAHYIKEVESHMREDLRKARDLAKAVGVDESTIASVSDVEKEKDAVGTPGAANETSKATGGSKDSDRQNSR